MEKKADKKEVVAVVEKTDTKQKAIKQADVKQLKQWSGTIRKELESVERSFVKIGYYLYQIKEKQLYEITECKNIYEYAKKEYGIARSTCCDFVNIIERFGERDETGNPVPKIAEKYKEYKSSQLIQLLGTNDEKEIDEIGITPDMTVKEIKQKVKSDSKMRSLDMEELTEILEDKKDSNVRTKKENNEEVSGAEKSIIMGLIELYLEKGYEKSEISCNKIEVAMMKITGNSDSEHRDLVRDYAEGQIELISSYNYQ